VPAIIITFQRIGQHKEKESLLMTSNNLQQHKPLKTATNFKNTTSIVEKYSMPLFTSPFVS
jgi:hypothetical protein